MTTTPDALLARLTDAAPGDRPRLRARLRGLTKRRDARPSPKAIAAIERDIARSAERWEKRRAATPRIDYPEELPVSAKRDDIAAAIRDNQVVVVCGETGSGKTTQLPKICLELGYGVDRAIGHTQPRRIAARTVAARIAEETRTTFGREIGCKVRFDDETSDDTLVKLMTDGILLTETRSDRNLDAYEVIIIDEAHERTLNIDFLIGCLTRLLPKRPDLKVIITSATIDPERFAHHFAQGGVPAPVIEVSGRTYPVDVHYRPLTDADGEEQTRLDDALMGVFDEIDAGVPGDTLVFMPGEREIRDTTQLLRGRYEHDPRVEVLPLYARLSPKDQQRVFKRHQGTRIVVATNVAETSLTVPGIRYVVDTGTARISRYSARSKLQSLPIEPVSRASADQRKGRCGRVGPGVCYRLFSQEDFDGRDEFTLPEIKRTSLASVVLQMADLGLGRPEEFPFLERPELRQIRDGYQTLHELGAVDEEQSLTPLGKRLARLPIDPRLARMILAGVEEKCLHDVLVIASGLTTPDPRVRPHEVRDKADAAHERFLHETSDFLSYLKIWDFYHEQAGKLSRSKLARACEQNFLSHRRIGEWRLLYRQLRALAVDLKLDPGHGHAPEDAVHRALLAGLLANVGHKKDTSEYAGTRGTAFHLFPGSSQFDARPKWVIAAEIVRTTRTYARTVGRVRPEWVEQAGAHLVQRSYSDERWDERTARVVANERVSLLGLDIVKRRSVHFGPIDPRKARELFIHHALVEGEWETDLGAIVHNRELAEHLATLEHKARRGDLLADAQARFAFYDGRLPADVFTGRALERWLKTAQRDDPDILRMTEADLLANQPDGVDADAFPDEFEEAGARLPLVYRYAPADDDDGVTLRVPTDALPRLRPTATEWVVSGLLVEKIERLIRTLPRAVRRQFDAPKLARELAPTLDRGSPMVPALAAELSRRSEVPIDVTMLRPDELPAHLSMRYEVTDAQGEILAAGRDLPALQAELGVSPETAPAGRELDHPLRRAGLESWDFDELPKTVTIERAGGEMTLHPCLVDRGSSVSIELEDAPELARRLHTRGVSRLLVRHLVEEFRFSAAHLSGVDRARVLYSSLGPSDTLDDDLMMLVAERACLETARNVRTRDAFRAALDDGWNRLGRASDEVSSLALGILDARQQILARLEAGLPPAWAHAAADLKAQTDALVTPGFLREAPFAWLRCVPRYFRAMDVRLERLRTIGPARDAERAREAHRWRYLYEERLAQHKARGLYDPGLAEFRWLIEELRVAQFAQELGTVVKVSPTRLEKAWARVEP